MKVKHTYKDSLWIMYCCNLLHCYYFLSLIWHHWYVMWHPYRQATRSMQRFCLSLCFLCLWLKWRHCRCAKWCLQNNYSLSQCKLFVHLIFSSFSKCIVSKLVVGNLFLNFLLNEYRFLPYFSFSLISMWPSRAVRGQFLCCIFLSWFIASFITLSSMTRGASTIDTEVIGVDWEFTFYNW